MKRLFWILLLLLITAGVVFSYYPPFRLLCYYVAGRSVVCPLDQALKSDDNLKQQIAIKDRILAASQQIRTDPKGFHLWATPKGNFWIPEGDDYVLPFNLAEQERRIYGAGSRGVQAGDVVLDCGANIGVTVREELKAGARKIVAIEPAPENVECLRRNFPDEIRDGRVILVPKGVWDKEDFLTLNVDPKNSAADSFVIQREGAVSIQKVPLTTIDHLVNDLKLDKVDYIKMDIEGAEPNALAGAHDTLARFKPRISISAYHAPDHPSIIPKAIRAARADYAMECGPCAEANHGVRPDVLYFY